MLKHLSPGKEECSNDPLIPAFKLPKKVKVSKGSSNRALIPEVQSPAEYTGHSYTLTGTIPLCTLFFKGECKKGAKCPFPHGKPAESIQASEEGLKQQVQDMHDLSTGVMNMKLNSNLSSGTDNKTKENVVAEGVGRANLV